MKVFVPFSPNPLKDIFKQTFYMSVKVMLYYQYSN